jgi:hypothetical protein
VVALLGLAAAYLEEGALVLLVAPTARQSELIFAKVRDYHRRLGLVPTVKELSDRLEMANQSRVIALPGSGETVRGFSAPRLIVIDESSYIEPSLKAAILPMLTGGGRLVMLGTPHGKAGWFYDVFTGADPSWERINARASESPRTDRALLEEMRASMSEREFAAEFDNVFVSSADAVFTEDAIERMLELDPPSVAIPTLDLEGVWRGLLARL